MMNKPILLCSDLDRTLLPNGLQPESPEARPLFRSVAAQPRVMLAYASGRDRALQQEAIRHYALPLPAFAIADVGTSIYRVADGGWELQTDWSEEISVDWHGMRSADIAALIGTPAPLRLQEPERQSDFKLSYYAPPDFDAAAFRARLDERLAAQDCAQLRIALVWSVDETRGLGLLDLMPARSTKLHALRFLMRLLDIAPQRCLYAGDSGNDLDVLASDIPAVLVRNARDDVRRTALRLAAESANADSLYLARGGLKGMNGYYAAGILEGMTHFLPETARWL